MPDGLPGKRMLNNRITLRVIVYRFFFPRSCKQKLTTQEKGEFIFFFLIRSCYTLTLPFFFFSVPRQRKSARYPSSSLRPTLYFQPSVRLWCCLTVNVLYCDVIHCLVTLSQLCPGRAVGARVLRSAEEQRGREQSGNGREGSGRIPPPRRWGRGSRKHRVSH